MRLIDADELKEAMQEHTDYRGYLVCDPEEIIDLAQTVERPHGEWNGKAEEREVTTRFCTSCNVRGAVGNFCMWCGADMRKKEVKEIPLEIEETIKNDTKEFFQSIGKYMKEVKSK